MNLQDEIARIERSQKETRKFAAETRETTLAFWPFATGGMIVGTVRFLLA